MPSFEVDQHIRLVPPELEMAEQLTSLVRRNLEHLRPWMPWAVADYGIDHARTWIESAADTSATAFSLLIFYDQELVGTIGVHEINTLHSHTSLGYWIDKDHVGRGIITRSCRVLLDHLFGTMKLNRVQINCNVDNVRSRAIPERLGFTHEGILREVELVDGEFRDWAVYGLLSNEWQANRL